ETAQRDLHHFVRLRRDTRRHVALVRALLRGREARDVRARPGEEDARHPTVRLPRWEPAGLFERRSLPPDAPRPAPPGRLRRRHHHGQGALGAGGRPARVRGAVREAEARAPTRAALLYPPLEGVQDLPLAHALVPTALASPRSTD